MNNGRVRTRNLQPSPTSSLNARIKRLAAEGRPICHLSAGEVGGQPPEHFLLAAARAATSSSGTWLRRDRWIVDAARASCGRHWLAVRPDG